MRRSILALAAFGFAISIPLSANAADTYVQRNVVEGPPAVVDSWMQPSYERVRENKDSEGNSNVVREPIIMERHERVVVPVNETQTTTTVYKQPVAVTETKRYVATRPVVRKKRASYRRHYVARKPARRYVARRPASSYVATKVVKRVEQPTVIERTDRVVRDQVIYTRPHPALGM
ncbi:MAG: hypothetical protein IAF58_21940 [Leptolyngbya sp.]|nr:hypothetical protein [Candidatus Melainabacteria bacterium]